MIKLGDVFAAFPRVDDPDVLMIAKSDPALRAAMDACRPPNWHGTSASHALLEAAQNEAIPLAWVPPAEVVSRLRTADTAEARSDILLEERAKILAACSVVAAECDAPTIEGDRALVNKSIAALQDGHDEAGMALAVSVGEGLAKWAAEPRVKAFKSEDEQEKWRADWQKTSQYRKVDLVAIPAHDVQPQDFIHQVLIAPISHFFTSFHPGDTVPAVMSRHVVAHAPSPDHMTPLNALKAVMLVVGILRSQQDWMETIRDS